MSVGRPRVLNVHVTALVSGSMRETVWSSVLRTQTAPSPTAMLLGAVAASVNEAIRASRGADGGDAVADGRAVRGLVASGQIATIAAVVGRGEHEQPGGEDGAAAAQQPRRRADGRPRAAEPSGAGASSISSPQLA